MGKYCDNPKCMLNGTIVLEKDTAPQFVVLSFILGNHQKDYQFTHDQLRVIADEINFITNKFEEQRKSLILSARNSKNVTQDSDVSVAEPQDEAAISDVVANAPAPSCCNDAVSCDPKSREKNHFEESTTKGKSDYGFDQTAIGVESICHNMKNVKIEPEEDKPNNHVDYEEKQTNNISNAAYEQDDDVYSQAPTADLEYHVHPSRISQYPGCSKFGEGQRYQDHPGHNFTSEQAKVKREPEPPAYTRTVQEPRGRQNESFSVDCIVSSPQQSSSQTELSFDRFSAGRKYLAISKADVGIRVKNLAQPLGVCFDEVIRAWIVTNTREDKIEFLFTERLAPDGTLKRRSLREPSCISKPSAVCILKPGHSCVALCESHIVHFEYTGTVQSIVNYKGVKLEFRGLAVSPKGFILTLSKESIVVYNPNKVNEIILRKPISGASPSFMHMCGSRLVISDLGCQKISLFDVHDAGGEIVITERKSYQKYWNHLSNLSGEPNGSFSFVSGVFLDVRGYVLVADARGYTFQLFDDDLNFLYRVPVEIELPYISSFWVNSEGVVMMCDRAGGGLVAGKLGSSNTVLPIKKLPYPSRGFGAARGRGVSRGGRGPSNSLRGGGAGGFGSVAHQQPVCSWPGMPAFS